MNTTFSLKIILFGLLVGLLPTQEKSFAYPLSSVSITLKDEHKRYEINPINITEKSYLERVRDQIFLITKNTRTLLGSIELDNYGKYRVGSPDIIVLDINFDRKTDFLVKQGEGVSDVYYSIVDSYGKNIVKKIFTPTALAQLAEIAETEDNTPLLSLPVFYGKTKMLECSSKATGPAPKVLNFKFLNNKWEIYLITTPFFIEKFESPLKKTVQYANAQIISTEVSCYSTDKSLFIIAQDAVQVQSTMSKRSTLECVMPPQEAAKIIDINKDSGGVTWLKIELLNKKSGWIKEADPINIEKK